MTPFHRRILAALEVLLFVVWSGAFLWIILPLNRADLQILNVTALLAYTVASHLVRGTPLSEIGLSYRHFMGAIKLLALPTLAAAIGAVPLGIILGSVEWKDLAEDWFSGLLTYPFWGLFQQYVFNGYLFVRVEEASGGRKWVAILASAVLYTLVHAPNTMLLILCLPIGLVWAWVFSRKPNLYALGLSHGLLGTTMKEFIENVYWAGLRVGPRLM